jgi:hypothetical protein
MNNKQALVGRENREAIRLWFVDHPCGTQLECAAALGFSKGTVNKHAMSIRQEWMEKEHEASHREVPMLQGKRLTS